ncbi:TWiK family of potassium channels protein 7-like [Limulus polyphemus]|uniref:TWiK family of potassium channels protein 7-like n=1 Tax=Limulus polyphemus TaxID=6850 RepID=A0ABM1BFF2_LIMPO|nr:TWiK family of potassium channels protein 7-like [Limulus polyphemus]
MQEEPSRCAKCRYYCRTGSTFVFSHIGLCGLVVGYTIMGAFTFEALEAQNEQTKREEIRNKRSAMVEALWDITAETSVLHEANWTKQAASALREFEWTLIKAVRKEGYDGKDEPPLQWNFSGALLYSIIVITTIGYGNIAPKTPWGKMVTILYAIIGIPLMLLCLSNIGDAMAHSFKFIYWKVCCYLCIKPRKKRRGNRPSFRHSARYSAGRNPFLDYGKNPEFVDTISRSSYYTAPGEGLSVSDYSPHSPTSPPTSPTSPTSIGLGSPRFPAPPQGRPYSDINQVPVIPNKYVLQGREDVSFGLSTPTGVRTEQPSLYSPPTKSRRADQCSWGNRRQAEPVELDLMEEESGSEDSDDEKEEVTVPIWLCSAVVIGYICGGAVLFTIWEGWNFLDSSYFCFVTLTTIGFGDLVPGTAVLSEDAQLTLGLCALYLLFGMALLAMSFNLVQEEVTKSVKCVGRRIGILSDEEDDN